MMIVLLICLLALVGTVVYSMVSITNAEVYRIKHQDDWKWEDSRTNKGELL